MLRIKIDGMPALQRKLRGLERDVADRAVVRAINRTVDSARAEMVRQIRERYAIAAKAVREKLRVRKAIRSNPSALLEATGKRSMNLVHFIDPKKVKRTPRGLSVKVLRSKGRVIVPGAFVANQGRTVFRRTGKSRLPIAALPALGVPQMFNQRTLNAAVRRSIDKNLKKNVEHELAYAVRKFNT